MGYLGRRIGLSQDKGDSTPGGAGGAVGGGLLDLFAHGYFERQGDLYNAPGAPPSGLTATGGIISDYTSGSDVYRAHVFTSSGTFDVTAPGSFGNTIEYLVIGGGGAGGQEGSQRGGGGGAGGYRTNVPAPIGPGSHTTSAPFVVSVSPYTVTVGGGGAGSPPAGQGSDGNDSIFGPPSSPARIISNGGGGGGQGSTTPPANEGRDGGSGGGGGSTASGSHTEPGGATTAVTTPSPWPGPSTQGFAGGQGEHAAGSWAGGGGGGGAGEVGHAAQNPNTTSGDGGDGLSNLIAGPLNTGVGVVNPASPGRWFAGGGAGMHFGGAESVGGAGGGGATSHPGIGGSGVYATGSGGACGTPGGFGGSGIVIVRYKIAEIAGTAKATGGSISFYNGKTIHAFTSSGTFINPASISNVDYIVLAGGGGGTTFDASYAGGAGGAGGYILKEGQTLAAATYPIQVGAGGELGSQGTPSVFNSQTAVGGGQGGKGNPGAGGGGGSGGGQGGGTGSVGAGQNFPGPTQQGHPGGNGSSGGGHGGGGGGFGGAGGASGPPDGGGTGGVGVQLPTAFRDPVQAPSDTTNPVPYQRGGGLGTPGPAGAYYVAGGGGGGTWSPGYGTKGGTGGAGGGGRGAHGPSDGTPALNGVENTGGGGGGSGTSINGSAGGSGVVLIVYPT